MQPTIREEDGAIVFDWGGGYVVEARPVKGSRRLTHELRVLDLSHEDQSSVIGIATLDPTNLRERNEFLGSLSRRDGQVSDWDDRLLLVADHIAQRRKDQEPIRPPSKGIWASEVQPRLVDWLWPNRIPAKRLTIIGGDPDVGKSMLTCDIAARVSVGGPWPDGSGNAPLGRVLILTSEDDLADTVVPRLERHGADLTRICLIGPEDVPDYVLPDGLEPLEERVSELQDAPGDPVFVVMDPLDVFLPLGGDYNRTTDVRKALAPLEALCHRLGMNIGAILHLNKRSTEVSAIYRFSASLAFVAAARAALITAYDPSDLTEDENARQRVFANAKGNLGRKATPLAYRIIDPGVIQWRGPVHRSVNELLQATVRETAAPQREEAEGFLRLLLADGAMASRQVATEARDAGIAPKTLERAKDSLEVVIYREGEAGRRGGGHWYWKLPDLDRHLDAVPDDAPNLSVGGGDLNQSRYESESEGGDLNTPPPIKIATSHTLPAHASEEGPATEGQDADAGERDYCLSLATELAYLRLEFAPGNTVSAGQDAWERFTQRTDMGGIKAAIGVLEGLGPTGAIDGEAEG